MRSKNKPIYVCDFETTSERQFKIEGRTRVYLFKISSLDGSFNKYGLSIEEFFEIINGFDSDSLIYFHNLSFDGSFVLWYLLENGYSYDNLYKENRGDKTYCSLIDEGNIYFSMNIINNNKMIIELRCSYKLMPYAIADIGTLVGIPKLSETHDYNEIKNYSSLDEVPEEEINYLNNDVEIMRLAIIHLLEYGIKGVTISSSAYSLWRSEKFLFIRDNLNKPEDEHINEVVDKSYRGGLTKVNEKYRGKLLTDVISFDVNSLYPSVMLQNTMPIGSGKIFTTIEEAEAETYKKQIVVVYVEDVKVKDNYHSFIGLFKGFSYGRYSYEDEVIDKTFYLWRDEYELFKMVYGGTYKILEVIGFKEASFVFDNYILKWYDKKKFADNEVERSIAKLMLNSLYGKFGMNDLRTSKIPVSYDEKGIIYEKDDNVTIYYYKPIASYITSMARVKTATAIQLCKERFVYCDTDSIYLTGCEMPHNIDIDGKRLGAWKYEGHYPRFKALKAKCYLKEIDNGELKSSIAGLPKSARDLITFENFDVGLVLKGVKRAKVSVKGGTIITDTDFSILAT